MDKGPTRLFRTFVLRLFSVPASPDAERVLQGQLVDVKQSRTHTFRDEHELLAVLYRMAGSLPQEDNPHDTREDDRGVK